MNVKSYRLSHRDEGDPYKPFIVGSENYVDGQMGFLWVIYSKNIA